MGPEELAKYAGEELSLSGPTQLYYVQNLEAQVYAVLSPYHPVFGKTEVVIMARIVNDSIVIDVDKTNKPLHEALWQSGVPDEQITLAWLVLSQGEFNGWAGQATAPAITVFW